MPARKTPETVVPTRPRKEWSSVVPSAAGSARLRIPAASSAHRPNTMLEWPSEDQKPTDVLRLPSARSLRVMLSIAAMWSASNAWRRPGV